MSGIRVSISRDGMRMSNSALIAFVDRSNREIVLHWYKRLVYRSRIQFPTIQCQLEHIDHFGHDKPTGRHRHLQRIIQSIFFSWFFTNFWMLGLFCIPLHVSWSTSPPETKPNSYYIEKWHSRSIWNEITCTNETRMQLKVFTETRTSKFVETIITWHDWQFDTLQNHLQLYEKEFHVHEHPHL